MPFLLSVHLHVPFLLSVHYVHLASVLVQPRRETTLNNRETVTETRKVTVSEGHLSFVDVVLA